MNFIAIVKARERECVESFARALCCHRWRLRVGVYIWRRIGKAAERHALTFGRRTMPFFMLRTQSSECARQPIEFRPRHGEQIAENRGLLLLSGKLQVPRDLRFERVFFSELGSLQFRSARSTFTFAYHRRLTRVSCTEKGVGDREER